MNWSCHRVSDPRATCKIVPRSTTTTPVSVTGTVEKKTAVENTATELARSNQKKMTDVKALMVPLHVRPAVPSVDLGGSF